MIRPRFAAARHLLAGTLIVAAACATGAPHAQDSTPNVLYAREIVANDVTNAYDAIKKYRANFLSYRGETSISNTSTPLPNVYVDGAPYGDLSTLRTIPIGQIAAIRLYRAYEAQTRFGAGNLGGVIEVTTQR